MKHPNNGVKKHVVIIGAGFAGLSAARHLLERSNGGVSVAVLEGGHRVGGRAHTAQVPRSTTLLHLARQSMHICHCKRLCPQWLGADVLRGVLCLL